MARLVTHEIAYNSLYTRSHTSHGTGIFTYIYSLTFLVNVGKYTIHGFYGDENKSSTKSGHPSQDLFEGQCFCFLFAMVNDKMSHEKEWYWKTSLSF